MEKASNALNIVRQMTDRAGAAHTVEEALRWILDLMGEAVPGEVRAFLLLDPGGMTLRIKSAEGIDAGFMASFERPVGTGILADVLWGGRVRGVRSADPSTDEYRELRLDRAFKSGIAAPLGAAGHRLGYLWVQSDADDRYDLEHLNLVAIAANLAGEVAAHIRARDECARHVPIEIATGLLRHVEFERRLGLEVERARRSESGLGLLMVHIEGLAKLKPGADLDECMGEMVDVARRDLRGADFLGRHSAARFEVCLPDASASDALEAAKRLHGKLVALSAGTEAEKSVKTLMGVAVFPHDATDVRGLVTSAGKSVLVARRPGSDRVVRLSGRD